MWGLFNRGRGTARAWRLPVLGLLLTMGLGECAAHPVVNHVEQSPPNGVDECFRSFAGEKKAQERAQHWLSAPAQARRRTARECTDELKTAYRESSAEPSTSCEVLTFRELKTADQREVARLYGYPSPNPEMANLRLDEAYAYVRGQVSQKFLENCVNVEGDPDQASAQGQCFANFRRLMKMKAVAFAWVQEVRRKKIWSDRTCRQALDFTRLKYAAEKVPACKSFKYGDLLADYQDMVFETFSPLPEVLPDPQVPVAVLYERVKENVAGSFMEHCESVHSQIANSQENH